MMNEHFKALDDQSMNQFICYSTASLLRHFFTIDTSFD